MSDTPQASGGSRREFLKLVGAAGLAAALPPSTAALAQTAGTPATPPAASPAKPAVEAPSADAVALAAVLRRRFPDRLTDAQWESVTRDFEGDLAIGKRLRALKLGNGAEPDSTFKA